MSTLLQYLASLAADPAAQQAFAADPGAAIAKADLSEEDRAILASGDGNRIHAQIGRQALATLPGAVAPPTQPAAIYASQPAAIYASQPAAIYASQPAAIYASQPAAIYASHPAAIYASH
ncbi:MAG: hypothetical protein KBI14_02060, partial [Kofleriaceae bacterium]|nr:hypothetical protein [Kofleriaceae bacterium]